ncbi:MAG: TonB-dependent receptor, partial [Bacteroidota bacterium]
YPARLFRPQAVLAPSGFADASSDIPFGLEPLASAATGYTRGIELFIQKKLSDIPLYGLMSLTVSESRFESLDGVERYGSYDSRMVLNLAAGYRFNEEWELSSKFRLATGHPTTDYLRSGTPPYDYLPSGRLDYTEFNEGDRLPAFHTLDVRLDKRWYFEHFNLTTYIDIQNIYGRENVSDIRFNYRTGQPEYSTSIGVLPSIGVNFEF